MEKRIALNDVISADFKSGKLLKITLSKPKSKRETLENVYVKIVEIKSVLILSFTYRYTTNDQTKNFNLEKGIEEINQLLENQFYNLTLFSSDASYQYLSNQKGNITFQKIKTAEVKTSNSSHNREKVKRSESNDLYLQLLGISDQDGNIIPSMADKYRQINKYLEIIDSQLNNYNLPPNAHIVDMGSGKGYLTFALYHFLTNKKHLQVNITGIELREELVMFCNSTAKKCGFENLQFVSKRIEDYEPDSLDMLIALHACDTATDDALFRAIKSETGIIICAPCCHKQIRQQVKGKEQNNPMLKYGIFKERTFEMVTDTIRALILEKNHYHTHIFEFVSNEHTRKNIMLTAVKHNNKINEKEIDLKINSIKNEYQIEFQQLERLLIQ